MTNITQFPLATPAVVVAPVRKRRPVLRAIGLGLKWFAIANVAIIVAGIGIAVWSGFADAPVEAQVSTAAGLAPEISPRPVARPAVAPVVAPAAEPAPLPAGTRIITQRNGYVRADRTALEVDCRTALEQSAVYGIKVGFWRGKPSVPSMGSATLQVDVRIKNAFGTWRDAVGSCFIEDARLAGIFVS